MKKGLITSILALAFGSMQAQSPPQALRLVVTLAIDQLRTDYMEAFSSLYGEHGFKRLMREGKVFRQVDFAFNNVDRASGIATLYTGASPSLHGIIAGQWMNRSTLRLQDAVEDPQFMGNYTNENSSPSQLLASTVADELKIGSSGKALVYAIAPMRDAAVLAAGHAGNGAFWINQTTGKWCGTTYYGDFPWWVSRFNENRSPDFRIRDMAWTPLLPADRYKFLPEYRTEAFKYKFDNDRTNQFRRLCASPLANDEVNRLAEELLDKTLIGRDSVPDILALTYYAGNYLHKSVQECAMEQQDVYVHIDQSIARLLEMLDKKIGLRNVLLCVVPSGYAGAEAADAGRYRTPGGEFYLNRCATLLNMYLMATYGEGQYVECYHDLQIYLNQQLIKDKGLELSDILEKSSQFLVQFSGVNEVYSSQRLLLGSWSPEVERIRAGYHRKRSGDLLIDVLPGWTVVQENNADNRAVRLAYPATPLIWMGPGIKAEIIRVPVGADRVAPTLTGLMRIRAPNACKANALSL